MKIRIKDLELETIIGIFDWERKTPQKIVVNVEMEFDGSRAAETDAIEDTVDYKTLNKSIIDMVEGSSFFLVEKLATEILNVVLGNEKVRTARVELDKPGALRHTRSVSIEVEGTRE